MKPKITGVLLGACMLVGLVILLPRKSVLDAAAPELPGGKSEDGRTAVIVELFTSEGCSSCPPADRLLSSLAARQPIERAEIIALSEHVDYWNSLGWTDPFSSSAFSERQRDYSESLKTESYTPQMVVDGKAAFVGSDQKAALAAISGELNAPMATVSIRPIDLGKSAGQNAVAFSIAARDFSRVDARGKATVFLAVTEDKLQSSVRAGENFGRSLAHTGVVRSLKAVSMFDIQPGAAFQAQSEIKISSSWKRKDLRAVVFVQDQVTRRIVGGAETAFPAPDNQVEGTY